jgi:two-component system response regulator YesN
LEDVVLSVVVDQPSDTTGLRVVLVDARAERRELMKHVVEGTTAGAEVVALADNKASAIDVVEQQHADAVVLDIQMPIEDGLDTIASLRSRFPLLTIVVCSFHVDQTTKQRALAQGADAYLGKPITPRELNATLNSLRPLGSASEKTPPTDSPSP